MNKKIIGIFVCTLLIANMYEVFGISEEKVNTIEKTGSFTEPHSHNFLKLRQLFNNIFSTAPIDWPDQKQKDNNHWIWHVNAYWSVAQSFTPTKDTLSKVTLYIYKKGELNWPINVAIREDLNGNDLTSTSVQYEFGDKNYSWISFDFPDIDITPGKKYYIIAQADKGNSTNTYGWFYANDSNIYPNGETYGAAHGINNWTLRPGDCCFVTYSSKTTNLEELSTQFPLFQLIIHKLNL